MIVDPFTMRPQQSIREALGMMARRWHDSAERITAVVAAVLVFLTFGPALAMFEELMSNGPHWMFAPLGTLILL